MIWLFLKGNELHTLVDIIMASAPADVNYIQKQCNVYLPYVFYLKILVNNLKDNLISNVPYIHI